MPIAVIAPLLVFWWGFGVLPKLVVIVLICFFPVLVTTVDGLAAVDPDQLKLLRTLDASRWQAFRFAELPAALPAAISGARIARRRSASSAPTSRSPRRRRRPYMRPRARDQLSDLNAFRMPRAYAAAVCCSRLAIACFYALTLAERRLAPWADTIAGERRRDDGPPHAARLARRGGARVRRSRSRACGAKQDVISSSSAKPFSVMLDWFPNADHAALYSAIAGGDFRAVGLEVQPVVPSETAEPLKLLAAGKVDMAISYEPELLLARDAGLKLVSIGALVQRPLTSIIALPASHVTSVASLAGKRVGTAGLSYQAAELRTALNAAGVNPSSVQEVNVGFNLVPAMLSGKVDATLGGFWNYEAVQLRLMHKRPVVIPVDQAGVPSYNELILVVREDEAHTRGQDLRAFMQALTQGERRVRADPAAAAALLVKANPSLEGKLQLQSIQQTLPAALPANKSDPFGWQEPSAWASFGSWMLSHGLLKNNPNAAMQPFTNEFLPGQGI